jgi:hypothetical protein
MNTLYIYIYIFVLIETGYLFWHVYVLGPVYFVWPCKSRASHVTSGTECNIDVTPGILTATDTYIGYHVTRFEASRNVIFHTRYVSTCVGAVCGRGRRTKVNITDTHNNNTCDKYKSGLRHVHDSVLSSLKMKRIRLLFIWVRKLDSDSLTETKNWSGRNEVIGTFGRLHPLWPQNKRLCTPWTTDWMHTKQDR